ncbi:hypothetical protein [Vreelandella titanicae]|uniref:hypothetical protein n=1 Tax=Vreelandella titanicae TaxID=664683 RepID=UPI003FD6F95A
MNKGLIGALLFFISGFSNADVSVIDTHVSKEAPVFEIVIENAGASAVARGHIATRFITPGREVPWVDSWEQSYSVPGGIEPGEKRTIQLAAPPEINEIKEYDVTAEVFFFSAFSQNRAPLNGDAEHVVRELERHERESKALQAELEEMMNSDL